MEIDAAAGKRRAFEAAQRDLATFGALPPTARHGTAVHQARSAICTFLDTWGPVEPFVNLRADSGAVARRGVYALLAGIASRAAESKHGLPVEWTKNGSGRIDYVLAIFRVLLEMLRGCEGGCTHRCGGDEELVREFGAACGGALQRLVRSPAFATEKLVLVRSLLERLPAEQQQQQPPPPSTAADAEEFVEERSEASSGASAAPHDGPAMSAADVAAASELCESFFSVIVREALVIKEEGNKEFGRGSADGYKKAHQLYSQALGLFPKELLGSFDRYDSDYVEDAFDKIQANRVLCSRRLGNWHRVVEEATALIGMRLGGASVVKAMHARAVAYENLERYDAALLDYHSVGRNFREADKWTELQALTERIDSLEARLDASNTDTILSWRRLEATGAAPGPRAWHTAVFWDGKMFFLYGGHANLILMRKVPDHDVLSGSSDIWILDYEEMRWTRKETTGRGPGGIGRHTACVRYGQMWVFGGEIVRANSLAGSCVVTEKCFFFVLDLATLVWKRVRKKNSFGPPRVKDHGAFIHGHRLYILGGSHEHDGACRPHECKLVPGFYSFNFKTSKWRKEPLPGGDDCPAATASDNSAICVKGNRMFVYGGVFTGINAYSGDLYYFHLNERKWSSGRTATGQWPYPRGEMRPVALGNSVIFHGGYTENASIGSRYLRDTCRLYVGRSGSEKIKWHRSGKPFVKSLGESLEFGRGKDDATPGCRAASSLIQIEGVNDRALLFGGYETLSSHAVSNSIMGGLWELSVSHRRPRKRAEGESSSPGGSK